MSELETIEPIDAALAKFSPVRAEIARLAKENAALVFQYDTKEGRKSAGSHIAKLRGKRGDVERVRTSEVRYHLDANKMINAAAKECDGELLKMIEVHDAPLRAIEEAEAAKIAAEQKRIEDERLAMEAAEKAEQQRQLDEANAKANAAEAELAAARQREREAQIARDAEDRAKEQAAEKLKRAEQDKIDAQQKAIDQQRQTIADARQAEIDKADAVNRATEAENKRHEQAKAAAQGEQKRLAEAEAVRLKDKKTRARITSGLSGSIIGIALEDEGEIDDQSAYAIATAILDGKIPNVTYSEKAK